MIVCGDMDEFELKKEDGGDPAIDRGIQLHIQVAEHTFNVAHIHFNNEVSDTDKVNVLCT